ncbi:MAG: N-formylglutamate amidohydrolase [Planctomycetes bacterium]|nr:N-formylglutamate amidohydrolase [Planctomycetota bacterium]
MHQAISSSGGVCDVEYVRGAEAAKAAVPDLLLEVPHGATLARHFVELRGRLEGEVPAELIDFFFVNTDIGAPELAQAIAAQFVAAAPTRTALVLRSLLPRTLVDCNRHLDPDARPQGTEAGQLTPGLPPWIGDPRDQRLLLALHGEYARLAATAFDAVCGAGGMALLVHSYAPRSLDVPVDDRIVDHLHAAYAPDRIEQWPLRAEVDLITHDPDGRDFAPAVLVDAVVRDLQAMGRQVERNGTYSLHPSTLAHRFAARYPGQCLCFEVRRDLLVTEFVPFVELHADPERVAAMAAPFARAMAAMRSSAQ